jgi:hypothetical protein
MAFRIQLRRDTAENWSINNPVLFQGEAGYETDAGYLKIGNGITPWNDLPYFQGTAGPQGPTGPIGPIDPVGPTGATGLSFTPTYKVYTALLSQSGTNPPVATVLENTLGVSITWAYGSLGNYNTNYITGDTNKVAIFCSQGSSPVSYSILSYANSSGPTVAFNIQTLANYTGAFIGAIGPNNGLLSNAFVEIRIYN